MHTQAGNTLTLSCFCHRQDKLSLVAFDTKRCRQPPSRGASRPWTRGERKEEKEKKKKEEKLKKPRDLIIKKKKKAQLFEENHVKLAIYLRSIPPGGFHGYLRALAARCRGGGVPAPCATCPPVGPLVTDPVLRHLLLGHFANLRGFGSAWRGEEAQAQGAGVAGPWVDLGTCWGRQPLGGFGKMLGSPGWPGGFGELPRGAKRGWRLGWLQEAVGNTAGFGEGAQPPCAGTAAVGTSFPLGRGTPMSPSLLPDSSDHFHAATALLGRES